MTSEVSRASLAVVPPPEWPYPERGVKDHEKGSPRRLPEGVRVDPETGLTFHPNRDCTTLFRSG